MVMKKPEKYFPCSCNL